jgi:hypothetical protein
MVSIPTHLDPIPLTTQREYGEPMTSARLGITRKLLMHLGHSDGGEAVVLMSPKVTYSVLGHNPLAGQFSGSKEVTRHLADLYKRTMGTYDTIKWQGWLEGDLFTAVVADVHIQVDGARLACRQFFLIEFDNSDLITAISVYSDRPDSMDRLFTQHVNVA